MVVVPGAAVETVTLGAAELRPVAVCGVEGSEEADHAAHEAADLLSALGFSLVLVHAFHGSVSAALPVRG